MGSLGPRHNPAVAGSCLPQACPVVGLSRPLQTARVAQHTEDQTLKHVLLQALRRSLDRA